MKQLSTGLLISMENTNIHTINSSMGSVCSSSHFWSSIHHNVFNNQMVSVKSLQNIYYYNVVIKWKISSFLSRATYFVITKIVVNYQEFIVKKFFPTTQKNPILFQIPFFVVVA